MYHKTSENSFSSVKICIAEVKDKSIEKIDFFIFSKGLDLRFVKCLQNILIYSQNYGIIILPNKT